MTKSNKTYNVAVYCRLSKEDGDREESASIDTQKAILTEYVKQQGWRLVRTYIDDGYTGLNFNRPHFQEMIKDIEAGLIDCVITKDLSRLGRNYLDCGLYLEVFFPEHNVRYIAVNDGVDTLNKTAMDITPFRNILNEMYSADVSMKVKSAVRARFNQGKFKAATPPYGYVKDPADKNHLLIDETVAPVVRKMFELALMGNGIAKIRHWLNGQRILRPAAYALERGDSGFERYFEGNEDNRYIWSENSVRGVLRSPVYAGHLVGYKRPAVSMKSRKRPSRLPEDWEVIPNTHEPIIQQEVFDTVQKLMTSRRRQKESGWDNIFSGVIKCADCGYHLSAGSANRRKRPELIDCIVYYCGNYTRYGNVTCTSHTIEARDLVNAVLSDINYFAELALRDEKAVKALQAKLNTLNAAEAKAYGRDRRKLQKRAAELDKLFAALYEDRVMERISERNYFLVSAKYEQEQQDVENSLKEIETDLTAKGANDKGIVDFLALIKGYGGLTELTAATVNTLIDKITVSERGKDEDGNASQRIKIYYKFVGSLHELHITPTKRQTVLPDKVCAVCGKPFAPGSAVAAYCPGCREVVRKETAARGNEVRKAKRRAMKSLAEKETFSVPA
jgi:DNA invertase Pin-like site-specific DNA recombinase/predicted nucleic acid-binding Zn ribbon protein